MVVVWVVCRGVVGLDHDDKVWLWEGRRIEAPRS